MTRVGWRNEGWRHSLAAKGVRTRYFSPFVKKTTVPVIDYPEEYHSIRQKSVVMMSPEEFLRLAKLSSEETERRSSKTNKIAGMSQEEYEKSVRNEGKVQRVKEGLKKGDEIPMGYLEYDAEKHLPLEHEGRHRAMAARELGMKEIPVALVRARKYKDGGWVYGEDELVPMKNAEEYKEVKRKVIPFK